MSNMSYCRFENTLRDLEDCQDNMDSIDEQSSESEARSREELIALCCDIALDHGDIVDRTITEE